MRLIEKKKKMIEKKRDTRVSAVLEHIGRRRGDYRAVASSAR